jgi:hypothetical protein
VAVGWVTSAAVAFGLNRAAGSITVGRRAIGAISIGGEAKGAIALGKEAEGIITFSCGKDQ